MARFALILALCAVAAVVATVLGAPVLTCDKCKVGVVTLRLMIEKNASISEIEQVITALCIADKKEDANVCKGIIAEFGPVAIDVIGDVVLNEAEICGAMGVCPPVNITPPPTNMTFPKPKPPHVPPTPPSPTTPKKVILHISDVHMDPLYVAGMNANCGEPLCCRASNGKGNGTNAAGPWGHYNCDLNTPMWKSMLSHIQAVSNTTGIDYVVWTGDNPPHDVWNQTKEGQISATQYVTDSLKAVFGKNTPIYGALGNHEGYPVNIFAPPPGTEWLYMPVSQQWAQWLPEEARLTFEYGGYYTVSPEKGLRFISLNMNYCNSGNFWLFVNENDPAGELEWMVKVLQQAEDNNEKVFILGHIPPGNSDCLQDWSNLFHQIVNRYEDIIMGQFYGHTHDDSFEVFYTTEGSVKRATNIAFVAPSVTTYQNKNPSYRLYTYDVASKVISDVDTYHADLNDANLNGTPNWIRTYNTRQAYSMPDLLPVSWDALITKLETNSTLFDLYYRLHTSYGPDSTCTGGCVKDELCGLKSAASSLYMQCMQDSGVELDSPDIRKPKC